MTLITDHSVPHEFLGRLLSRQVLNIRSGPFDKGAPGSIRLRGISAVGPTIEVESDIDSRDVFKDCSKLGLLGGSECIGIRKHGISPFVAIEKDKYVVPVVCRISRQQMGPERLAAPRIVANLELCPESLVVSRP